MDYVSLPSFRFFLADGNQEEKDRNDAVVVTLVYGYLGCGQRPR